MINVVQEIVDKLRTVYPSAQYDIYTERIEQGFSAPCFSIRQLRADVTPYPSGLHEIVQHMDVRFFPSDSRPQEQCREIAQTLTLLLRRTESLCGSNPCLTFPPPRRMMHKRGIFPAMGGTKNGIDWHDPYPERSERADHH